MEDWKQKLIENNKKIIEQLKIEKVIEKEKQKKLIESKRLKEKQKKLIESKRLKEKQRLEKIADKAKKMKKYNPYIKSLQLKGLSDNTIKSYIAGIVLFDKIINDIDALRLQLISLDPNSQRHRKATMISYLKFLDNNEFIEKLNEFKLKPHSTIEKQIPPYDYFMKKTMILRNDPNKDKKCLILFLFFTGLRVSELKSFEVINDIKIKVLGKGGKMRTAFHDPVYTNHVLKMKIPSSKTIRVWVKQILGKQYAPHDMRRMYATYLLNNGANPKMVQKSMGHSNIKTTFRYVKTTEDEDYEQYKIIKGGQNVN